MLIKYEHVNLTDVEQASSQELLRMNGYEIYVEREDTIGILSENT